MALLKIAQLGHPVLRSKAQEVPHNQIGTRELDELIDSMVETMRDSGGVGIAATQVHELRRIFAIEVRDAERYEAAELFDLLVVINPVVEATTKELTEGLWEGCLSMWGLRGLVRRARVVRLTGLDREGRAIDVKLEGFTATVAQHEADHLDGVLFVDRMTDLRDLAFEAEYRRFHGGATGGEEGGDDDAHE